VGPGDGEDEVPEAPEARVASELLGLSRVEVDRPPAEGDGRRRAALRAHDAGGAARRALTDEVALEHHDAPGAAAAEEHQGPSADGPGADDDEVRRFPCHVARESSRGGTAPRAPLPPLRRARSG